MVRVTVGGGRERGARARWHESTAEARTRTYSCSFQQDPALLEKHVWKLLGTVPPFRLNKIPGSFLKWLHVGWEAAPEASMGCGPHSQGRISPEPQR